MKGHLEVVRLLLDRGADLNAMAREVSILRPFDGPNRHAATQNNMLT
jgi:hypothetical protein